MIKPVMNFTQFCLEFQTYIDHKPADHGERLNYQVKPYPPVLTDLYSLYTNVRKHRAIAILEFGSGWSTSALALGLEENRESYGEFVYTNLRHPNPFRLMTVDASSEFLEIAVNRAKCILGDRLLPHLSEVIVIDFKGQLCHVYDNVPNFTSDFIYLDGPDANQVKGKLFGRSLDPGVENEMFLQPMSADILIVENFFWPGTVVTLDGRGANARFLQTHLTRSWKYRYEASVDQHFFELKEDTWGKYSSVLLNLKREVDADI